MYDPNDEIVRRIYGKEGLSEAYTTSSSQITSNDGNRIVDESLDLSLDYLPKVSTFLLLTFIPCDTCCSQRS